MKHVNQTLNRFDEGMDILSSSVKIKELAKTNPNLINATIGTLYNEDGTISVLSTIKDTLATLNDNEIFAYSATQGPSGYDKALTHFLFGEYEKTIRSKKHIGVIPTPGATGALNESLSICLNENDTVILPSICWNVYFNICKTMNINYIEYDYIKDNHFDLKGFINCVEKVSKKQKHIVTILNDPCNNPTGYSLNFQEFKELIDYINSRTDLEFTLIYDIAYYEYSVIDNRKKFEMLSSLNDHVLTIITWSSSKAFTMYGMRLGAMIILDSSKQLCDEFANLSRSVARSKWSCVSSSALNLTYKIMSNDDLINKVFSEIKNLNEMLQKRADLFVKQAQIEDLSIIPYNGGFFIAIPYVNPSSLSKKLEEKNIFVIPFNKVIRVAICSLPLNKCDGLARKIKEAIDELG